MDILVVDDDEATREVLLELLSLEGFTVSPVNNLEGALALLAARSFDLVLTDSFLRSFREAALVEVRELVAAAGTTPVLLLTAHGEAKYLDAADYGLAGLILKPFDIDNLVAEVRAVLAPEEAP
jgi:DNA-binding response OmpR family regulator